MPAEAPLLRTQLFAWLLVPLLALLAVDAFVSYRVTYSFAQQAYDRALVEIARDLMLQVRADERGRLRLDFPESAKAILFQDPLDTVYYELVDGSGRLIAGDPIAPPAAYPARIAEWMYDSTVGDADVRAVQLRFDAGGTPAVVRVAETRRKRSAMASDIMLSVLLPQILLIALSAAMVWLGITRGLAPLDRLQRAIAQRSHLDRSPLEEHGVPGEVRPLVASVNALLGRLDNVLTLQERFIADAAHQLKTPVAGLQAQVELLTRSPEGADLRGIAARLYVGVERLSRLVSQLLSLARNEPGAVRSLAFEHLDLNALVLDIASQWVPVALKRDIDLGFEGSEHPVMIEGDPGRLRELFDNLLDNAIRYSKEGGRVTMRVGAAPAPTVSVSDDGPSIPESERRRVFERFHRLLGSGEGSGLGLAIAQEIARLHDTAILLRDDEHDGVGNIFSITFSPLPDPKYA